MRFNVGGAEMERTICEVCEGIYEDKDYNGFADLGMCLGLESEQQCRRWPVDEYNDGVTMKHRSGERGMAECDVCHEQDWKAGIVDRVDDVDEDHKDGMNECTWRAKKEESAEGWNVHWETKRSGKTQRRWACTGEQVSKCVGCMSERKAKAVLLRYMRCRFLWRMPAGLNVKG